MLWLEVWMSDKMGCLCIGEREKLVLKRKEVTGGSWGPLWEGAHGEAVGGPFTCKDLLGAGKK